MNGLMLTPGCRTLAPTCCSTAASSASTTTAHDDGRPEVSRRFDRRDLVRLGLGGAAPEALGLLAPQALGLSDAQAPYVAAGLRPEQRAYREYHRRAVFVA